MYIVSAHEQQRCSILPIYVTTAGCGHNQERKIRPRGAPFHHLFYVEDGEGVFETATERHVIQKGTMLFIQKDTPITYYARTDPFQTAWVTFDGNSVADILRYFGAESFSFCNGTALYPSLLSCIKLCMMRQTAPEHLSSAIYELLVAYFSSQCATNTLPPIVKAREFIEKNYAHDISITELARVARISQSLLFRLFREQEKRTPIEYLRDVRLKHAKELLLSNPDLRVGEIAALCGFSDFAYFCKVFKNENGITPNAFRDTYGI